MINEFYVCDCNSLQHTLVISYDNQNDGAEVPSAYINVRLYQSRNFFKRLKLAAKYVFGFKSEFGDFDEFILKHEDIERMINSLVSYKEFLEECIGIQ
jgi:hypothetical protein